MAVHMAKRASDKQADLMTVRRRLASAMRATEDLRPLPPEQAKQLLDGRALKLARPVLPPPANLTEIALFVFTLATERYAVEARYAHRVARLGSIAPLPGAVGFVTGLASFGGGIIAVLDLRELFGLPTKRSATNSSYIIAVGEERTEFGILADEVIGMSSAPATDLVGNAALDGGVKATYIRGITSDVMTVLDVVALRKPWHSSAHSANVGQ